MGRGCILRGWESRGRGAVGVRRQTNCLPVACRHARFPSWVGRSYWLGSSIAAGGRVPWAPRRHPTCKCTHTEGEQKKQGAHISCETLLGWWGTKAQPHPSGEGRGGGGRGRRPRLGSRHHPSIDHPTASITPVRDGLLLLGVLHARTCMETCVWMLSWRGWGLRESCLWLKSNSLRSV